MKLVHFDCSSGISGDMVLGALVDSGIPLDEIEKGLKRLKLKGYWLTQKKVKRGLFGGTKVDVVLNKKKPSKKSHSHHHHSRNFTDIKKMIEGSGLPKPVVEGAVQTFERLGRAEAKVHRSTLAKVHFHEVGAIDSIVDIVGSVFAMKLLGPEKITCSSINTGEGTITCDHGVLPVPAPATLELLKGVPCYSSGIQHELTTPTGAAILGYFVDEFGPLPRMTITNTGYGAGSRVLPEIPNLLRIIVGESAKEGTDRFVLIETNIDDMNPEFYDHVMDQLFGLGALDVYMTSIQMKKNRSAVKLSVLAKPEGKDKLTQCLFRETTTFGLRFQEMDRMILDREIIKVKVGKGTVKVKIGRLGEETLQCAPEYDDCKRIASKSGMSVKTVYEEAKKLAEKQAGL